MTRGSGYEIRIEPDQLDLGRFERRVEEARAAREASDPATASARLREALDLWRGPPLADFAYEPFAQPAIGRLEELRLSALEDWVDAELALGHHDRLIGDLEALVSNHPLRERLRGQLILALYRSGRQSEALEQYRQTRRVLVEELGLEPSLKLQQLERAILTQDPALELESAEQTNETAEAHIVPAGPGPARAPQRGRRWLLPAVAIVLLVAIGAVLAVLLAATGSGSAQSTGRFSASRLPGNSVVAIDPGSNSVDSVVRAGLEPGALAMDGDLVWVNNVGERTVSEIDARSRKVVRTIGVGALPDVLAAGEGVAWVASREGRSVMIDGRTGHTRPWSVEGIHVDPGTTLGGTIAFGHGSLWIGLANTLTVWRVDPISRRVKATIRGIDARTIASTPTALWVLDGGGRISRIDPRTNTVAASIPFGGHEYAAGLAAGDGAVWALDYEGQRLLRIDAEKSRISGEFPLEQGLGDGVAVGGRAVWVTQRVRGTILRIDPATGRVTARIRLGHLIQLGSIGYGRGRLWVGLGVPIQS